MTKIYIIHENDSWVEPLRAELEALKAPYEEWHMRAGAFDMSNAPPEGVFYNRMSASSHTRGHRFAPEYTSAVLNWLEQYGRRVVNNTQALQLEISKAAQERALKDVGIKTPKSIYAYGPDDMLKAAENFTGPFITKHNRAGRGLGVKLFQNAEELKSYIYSPDYEESVDGVHILQQYIKAPVPIITRAEFVGGKFLYAVQVDTSEGFELCPADACNVEDAFCPANSNGEKFMIIENFSHDNIPKYEKMLAANGIEIAGIEFIHDENGVTYTYDVNTNTNYNSLAETHSHLKGMKAVAEFLKDELQKENEAFKYQKAS